MPKTDSISYSLLSVRGLVVVLYPLWVIVWFYFSCTYFVKFDSIFLEVLFAKIATIVISIMAISIEQHLEKVDFNLGY